MTRSGRRAPGDGLMPPGIAPRALNAECNAAAMSAGGSVGGSEGVKFNDSGTDQLN
jgi:hypothetical protein